MRSTDEHVTEATTRFLLRYASPRHLAGESEAAQAARRDEARAITRAVRAVTPADGAAEFLRDLFDRIAQEARTRVWPTAREIHEAAHALASRPSYERAQAADDMREAGLVDLMARWFAKLGDEMPAMGRPSRTVELIRRGVLSSLREARYRGFALDEEQRRQARDEPELPEEREGNERVMAALRRNGAALEEHGAPAAGKPTTRRTAREQELDEWV